MTHTARLRSLALALLVTVGPSAGAAPDTGAGSLPPLAAAFMLRGYFLAASPVADRTALGGFATSANLPRRLDRADIPAQAVSLVALPDEALRYDDSRGFRVLLANTTRKQVEFEASDSRLSIVREALDADGAWKPIEYLPSSWCGNSYHRVFLPPGRAWSFAAPVYAGSQSTTMRFKLLPGDGRVIYSNEFPGRVDPRQFSVKEGHTATDVMDPYDD